ncbi:MAG: DUF2490 domain-containing protein [Candidatus Korobacteraceae bacterium]
MAQKLVLSVVLVAALPWSVSAQSQTTGEFWPAADAHVQLSENTRLLAFVGLKKGEDFAQQEVNAGLGAGYQWKRITRPHLINIDPEKEHLFSLGAGYERIDTFQSGTKGFENRIVLQALGGFRPTSRLYVYDRNRGEFRWINGTYSTRYRNLLFGQYDISIHNFRFSPYVSAEVFYSGLAGSWNEGQYSGGIEWPYKRILMVQTYYLRENCTTCTPAHLNVGGLTLNLFLGRK